MSANEAHQRPIVAITMGDPGGIGPEVSLKALADDDIFEHCRPVILGDAGVLSKCARDYGVSLAVNPIQDLRDIVPGVANVLSLSTINLDTFRFGELRSDLGMVSTFYIVKAAELAMKGDVDALVTGPINKAALHQAGFDHSSHSEMLKAVAKVQHIGVMLVGEKLRITRVTSHMPLKKVPEALTEERVYRAILETDRTLRLDGGIANPKLAVCGLNPHNGDSGLFGDEEERIIAPAVERAQAADIDAIGPLQADQVFPRARDGEFDCVVVMYHDQGHVPFRLIDPGFGVNVTLGLPIIRTSPDHGAAYRIAGKGYASERAMRKAIELAAHLADNRRKREAEQQAG